MDGYGDIGVGSGTGGRRGGFSPRNIRTFSSLKNPVYRLFYVGILGQNAGMNMQMFARTWLVARLTDSPRIAGFMGVAFAVPMICLSLFGGVMAERVQKKYVLIIGQVVSAMVSLGIAFSLSMGFMSPENPGSWWVLFVSGILHGAVMALMMPSMQTLIPEIVGEEQLMNAISLSNMGMNTLRIFAPAITGFLIGSVDYQGVYYVMAGMYMFSAIFISFLPRTRKTVPPVRRSQTGIREGFRYLRRETTILIIVVLSLVAVVLSMPYQMLLPFLAKDVLNVGEAEGGTLMSISGIGAIVSSIILASLPNKKRGLMMLIAGIILGAALTSFSFSTLWPLSMGLMIFVGMGQAGNMTLGFTLLQYYSDEGYRGRVMSIMMMQFGLMGLGTLLAGQMAEQIGVQWAIGGFAMALAFLSVLAMVVLPRIRNLD